MTIQEAKEFLRSEGYFVDVLWHVTDVQDRFECDDETAQDILYSVFQHEYVNQQIHSLITDEAVYDELKEKEI